MNLRGIKMDNYFSPSTMGFYDESQPLPLDAIPVNASEEEFIREAVIWGASTITIANGTIVATYPDNLKDYVETYHAPTNFP